MTVRQRMYASSYSGMGADFCIGKLTQTVVAPPSAQMVLGSVVRLRLVTAEMRFGLKR
jgi:hypothetical protein